MADTTSLPAPSNSVLKVVNSVMDVLVLGLGENAAVSAGVAAAPFLGWPVINLAFKWFVSYLAKGLDASLKSNADRLILRLQNNANKQAYDQAIAPVQQASDEGKSADEVAKEIQAAKDAIDKLVNRNK